MTETFLANGSQTTKAAVVLAHSAERFDQNTAELVALLCGRRVLVINPSAIDRLDPGPELFELMVEEIDAVRRSALDQPVVFWGMSGGAWLGQLLAKRHPEAVQALILESGCACFRERLADPLCAMSLASDGTIVSPIAMSERMQRTTAAMLAFDSRAWLPQLHVPTLVLASDEDPVCPSTHSKQLAHAIPGARFVCVDGNAHVPSVTGQRAAGDAARAFLASIP